MINYKNSVRGEKILVNVDITLQAPLVGGWETVDGSGALVDGFGSRGVGSGGGDCAFRFVSGRGGHLNRLSNCSVFVGLSSTLPRPWVSFAAG